jgi:N-dimethylarginine dimethylaminohydrolase
MILGHMRHPVRQAKVEPPISGFLPRRAQVCRDRPAPAAEIKLTGSLVIDRARGLGYCGLSERCDETGAAAMHDAFGLRATLLFDLAPGEYHGNVVLSVLAGRAAVIAADGFADPAVAAAIAGLYAPHAVMLSAAEKQAFAGNCLALSADQVWMSEAALEGLSADHRIQLEAAGFKLRSVPLDEIEGRRPLHAAWRRSSEPAGAFRFRSDSLPGRQISRHGYWFPSSADARHMFSFSSPSDRCCSPCL